MLISIDHIFKLRIKESDPFLVKHTCKIKPVRLISDRASIVYRIAPHAQAFTLKKLNLAFAIRVLFFISDIKKLISCGAIRCAIDALRN